MSKEQWEQEHGQPNRENECFYNYENDRYIVSFSFLDENTCAGNVWTLSYQPDGDLSETEAVKIGESLMPRDARFIREYRPDAESVVRVYSSRALRSRFEPDDWYWGEDRPGTFIVAYYTYLDFDGGSQVSGIDLSTGNNP
jgi:hypothetical protein